MDSKRKQFWYDAMWLVIYIAATAILIGIVEWLRLVQFQCYLDMLDK